MSSELGHGSSGRAYLSQDGQVHLNGANLYDQGEAALPQQVAISAAAGSANVSLVTFQVKDGAGTALAAVFNLDVWLSDDATAGAGLTATSASGAVAAGASGADLGDYTAKKAKRVQTDATGKYILSITDTGKTGFVPCAQCPGTGKTVVGAALVAGNYG